MPDNRLPDEPASVQAGRVEIRCPQPYQYADHRPHNGKLLAVLAVGTKPSFIQPDNLIELVCAECKRAHAQRGERVTRVLHRYDFAGNFVSTLVEMAPA
jgi:hypothetical protein